MHSFLRSPIGAVCVALLLTTATARADDFVFNGNLTYHNDVVQIDFSLAAAGANVRIWTDSWLAGLNFDPTAALWVKSGTAFELLQTVDDDDTVAPGQGYYDAGFSLPSLGAGDYRVTLAAAINAPNGTLLSQGFNYDAQQPVLISEWNQPSYDPNANDQKGNFWQLHLRNVTQASPVPEPATWLLFAVGAAALARRRSVWPVSPVRLV